MGFKGSSARARGKQGMWGTACPARLDVFPFAINLESVLLRAECRQLLAWLSLGTSGKTGLSLLTNLFP